VRQNLPFALRTAHLGKMLNTRRRTSSGSYGEYWKSRRIGKVSPPLFTAHEP
jgi:hypothetical protein